MALNRGTVEIPINARNDSQPQTIVRRSSRPIDVHEYFFMDLAFGSGWYMDRNLEIFIRRRMIHDWPLDNSVSAGRRWLLNLVHAFPRGPCPVFPAECI